MSDSDEPTIEKLSDQSNSGEGEEEGENEKTELQTLLDKNYEISEVDGLLVTAERFKDLPVEESLKEAVGEMGIDRMTEIQAKSIPLLLQGNNILASAKTGMGKTLSFLVPAIELLSKTKFTHRQGVGVIIITPTRELAIQINDVAKLLLKGRSQTSGIVMGGANKGAEEYALLKGMNLVVATPGRLMDHLQSLKNLVVKNLLMLVIDEADRLLQIGFEEEMRQIIELLPKKRQTALFSATQTSNVKRLALVAFPEKPVVVSADRSGNLEQQMNATVSTLEQGYVVTEPSDRFRLLFTFLKKNESKKKILVFFSSRSSVQFHAELFNYVNLRVMELHGKKKQNTRTSVYRAFCSATKGILLATDVAARGLDIPAVDWIVQYDPPDDPKEYIHRVGRTARAGGSGKALLFLMKNELGFLRHLKDTGVNSMQEYEFPSSKLANIQMQLENLIERNFYLHKSATDAYRGYLLAYASHHLKECYDVHSLDLASLCRSFGLKIPPRVNLSDFASFKDKNRSKKIQIGRRMNTAGKAAESKDYDDKLFYNEGGNAGDRAEDHEGYAGNDAGRSGDRGWKRSAQASRGRGNKRGGGSWRGAKSGHKFSADNPRGKRSPNDKRQFTM